MNPSTISYTSLSALNHNHHDDYQRINIHNLAKPVRLIETSRTRFKIRFYLIPALALLGVLAIALVYLSSKNPQIPNETSKCGESKISESLVLILLKLNQTHTKYLCTGIFINPSLLYTHFCTNHIETLRNQMKSVYGLDYTNSTKPLYFKGLNELDDGNFLKIANFKSDKFVCLSPNVSFSKTNLSIPFVTAYSNRTHIRKSYFTNAKSSVNQTNHCYKLFHVDKSELRRDENVCVFDHHGLKRPSLNVSYVDSDYFNSFGFHEWEDRWYLVGLYFKNITDRVINKSFIGNLDLFAIARENYFKV